MIDTRENEPPFVLILAGLTSPMAMTNNDNHRLRFMSAISTHVGNPRLARSRTGRDIHYVFHRQPHWLLTVICRAQLVNRLDHCGDMIRFDVRDNAVAKVEDVTRT